jgi:hypothetical protein
MASQTLGSSDLAALWLASRERAQAREGVGGTVLRREACWRAAASDHAVSSPPGPRDVSPVLAAAAEGSLPFAGGLEGGGNGNSGVMGLFTSTRGCVGGARGGGSIILVRGFSCSGFSLCEDGEGEEVSGLGEGKRKSTLALRFHWALRQPPET